MIVISLQTQIEQLITDLRNRKERAMQLVRDGMIKGVRNFEGTIVKKFYTGRRGNEGLNRITGTAARGWFIQTSTAQDSFSIKLANKVKYTPIHEFGGTIKNAFGRGIVVTIPKRTDNTGYWKNEGIKFLNRSVRRSLRQYLSKFTI